MKLNEKIGLGGVYYTYPDQYTVVVSEIEDGYCMSWHKEQMPAYAEETFKTFEELKERMREVAPLNKWRQIKE